ncbi:hypothetical protein [Paucibacter sp. M5-1]|uniref:hypothetical protein n=1 Tax=Paucibacter sp. M5-1 TaxID=3015998 RepID=UPI0022B91101|nr:hypothetical protein [Paucibacter sp. M5-1]MCZ7883797.1 hypothetical protein [Paucibacter sp. M5-1]
MQRQSIDLPDIAIGETWTLKLSHESAEPRALRLLITTAGGTIISVPVHYPADIILTAGADSGSTLLVLDIDGTGIVNPLQLN